MPFEGNAAMNIKHPEPVHKAPRPTSKPKNEKPVNDNGLASRVDAIEDVTEADIKDVWTEPSDVKIKRPNASEAAEEIDVEGTVSSPEEVFDLEASKTEIEATEIEGFEGARVFVGMRNKYEAKVSEDYLVAVPEHGIVGVADGIGSSRDLGGDVKGLNPAARASRVLSATITDQFGPILDGMTKTAAEGILNGTKILDIDPNVSSQQDVFLTKNPAGAAKAVKGLLASDPEAARKAAALVETLREAQGNVKKTNGQTTACVAVRHGNHLIIANVGDSMAFIQRPNGEVVQVTREDSLLNDLLDDGRLTPERATYLAHHPEEKESFDMKKYGMEGKIPFDYRYISAAILSGIGGDLAKANATLTILDIEPGSRLIMATDGITDKIRDEDGKVDPKRLATYLGRKDGVAPTDQIETAIEVSAVEKTAAKNYDDDKTLAVMDII